MYTRHIYLHKCRKNVVHIHTIMRRVAVRCSALQCVVTCHIYKYTCRTYTHACDANSQTYTQTAHTNKYRCINICIHTHKHGRPYAYTCRTSALTVRHTYKRDRFCGGNTCQYTHTCNTYTRTIKQTHTQLKRTNVTDFEVEILVKNTHTRTIKQKIYSSYVQT